MKEPTSLFKYQPYNANSLSLLAHRNVWLAEPSTLNDPFDVSIRFNGEISEQRLINVFRNKFKQELTKDIAEILLGRFKSLHKDIEENLKALGVCSFTEDGTSVEMWSHYANSHTGFCLEFEAHNLSNLNIHPVSYRRSHKGFDYFEILNGRESLEKCMREILYVKPKQWQHEKEWRHVFFFNDRPNGYDRMTKYPTALKSIRFGARMKRQHRLTIIKIIEKELNEIELYHMQIVPNRFELKAEKNIFAELN
ncbi:MAG TPA: DUF2971 domain-containing protein [Oligoflexia bacterium]|nr:DUF2971 domain-containing protein [Oligoflexia bacterium]HMP47310.1 DUF2971 domain-containing protein [Oligoflexia bacterium]